MAVSNDLLRELGIDPTEPKMAAAIADATAAGNLMATLVAYRRAIGLGDAQVASYLRWGRDALEDFERLGGDPTISALQRYARALGLRVDFIVEPEPVPPPDGRAEAFDRIAEVYRRWVTDDMVPDGQMADELGAIIASVERTA